MLNDLASFLPNCDVTEYADDTQLILSSNIDNLKDLIQKAEDTLNLAKIYLIANGLMLNAKKKMYFHRYQEAFITDSPRHPPDGGRQRYHPQYISEELRHIF